MAPLMDDVRAKLQEKRERVKAKVEEIKGKIEERRVGGSSHSNPGLKIRAEIKEKGVIPAIRDRIEARRARRLGAAAGSEVEVEEEAGLKFERKTIAIEG